MKGSTFTVVPDNASVILRSGDGNVGGAVAVTELKGINGGTVAREGFKRGRGQWLTGVIARGV